MTIVNQKRQNKYVAFYFVGYRFVYNLVQYFGFLSVKKSTLALTALPVLRSTAVAIISVSPNFIWTWVHFEFQILLLLCNLVSD